MGKRISDKQRELFFKSVYNYCRQIDISTPAGLERVLNICDQAVRLANEARDRAEFREKLQILFANESGLLQKIINLFKS